MKWTDFDYPIVGLAPMADLTDLPFSLTIRDVWNSVISQSSIGPIVFREMVSSHAVVMRNEKTLKMIKIDEREHPVIQQIVGGNPSVMAEAAKIIINESNPDGIDINMGCPANKINKSGGGAILMLNSGLACDIVKAVKSVAGNIPVSAKIRLGWNDALGVFEFCKCLEDVGIDLISIHGRTRSQNRSGIADWNMIKEVKKTLSIPVLANGDIVDETSAKDALKITSCDGLLIGRGALGNPWIFPLIESSLKGINLNITTNDRIDAIIKHLTYHMDHYGDKGYTTFRKHMAYYLKSDKFDFDNIKELRKTLVTATDANKAISILQELKTNHL